MLLLRGATGAPFFHSKGNACFNTCSSCEEQLVPVCEAVPPMMFQYMLLLRGATSTRKSRNTSTRFNTCSSCEEQHAPAGGFALANGFQYMLLLRGATLGHHVLRPYIDQFQYMLLLRGATCSFAWSSLVMSFNTCSSCEEQQELLNAQTAGKRFNTCSSCEEQLDIDERQRTQTDVSIHAPLARSNDTNAAITNAAYQFQYMLLLRGATYPLQRRSPTDRVSIHAPLARSNFNAEALAGDAQFQYMLLLRGATGGEIGIGVGGGVSIHAPLARSNKETGVGRGTDSGFNTCSSCEEQQLRLAEIQIRGMFQYMLLLRGATRNNVFEKP